MTPILYFCSVAQYRAPIHTCMNSYLTSPRACWLQEVLPNIVPTKLEVIPRGSSTEVRIPVHRYSNCWCNYSSFRSPPCQIKWYPWSVKARKDVLYVERMSILASSPAYQLGYAVLFFWFRHWRLSLWTGASVSPCISVGISELCSILCPTLRMKPTRIRMCHSLVMNYGLYKKMEIFVRNDSYR
jgi:histone deacetylase 1/2